MNERAVIYLIRDPERRAPGELGRLLRLDIAPRILELDSIISLQLDVADESANVKTPSLKDPRERALVAFLKIKLREGAPHAPIGQMLSEASFRSDAYLVEEAPYIEYGENRHAGPRDWPDGARSPGIVAITCLARPPRIAHEEWMRRWHGRMSPVSEAIQPRTRYMRNVVVEALTEGAPPLGGIVEESYPSKEHVEDPYLFYGASGPLELAKNMLAILRAVTSFVNIAKLRTTMMSEYFLLTAAELERPAERVLSAEPEGEK